MASRSESPMIRFFVKGIPIPQARPRTFWHKAAERFVTMSPRRSEGWKQNVGAQATPHRPRAPLQGPVRLFLDFYLPKPRGMPEGAWADKRPDLDNLMKAVMDALQAGRFFEDDAQIVWLEARKSYVLDDHAGVEVFLIQAPPAREDL